MPKFGIWAHWSPQCVPEKGDWYARNMYLDGQPQREYHLAHYGPPSRFGYKDLCAQ
jgi:alpha-L-fucosidase